MKRLSVFFVFIFSSLFCVIMVTLFACNAKNTNTQASSLQIKSLSLNGKKIEPYREIELNDVEKIEAGDIKATFAYAQIEGEVELPLYVRNAPLKLEKNVPVRVEVYVKPKQDEYQGWQTSFNAILR